MFRLEIEPAETLHTKFGNAKIYGGYYHITTRKEGNTLKYLHRLIFEDFYGKIPEGCHIHHKDGHPLNNCIMNLQLLTHKEHMSLHKKGENNPLYGKTLSDETKRKMSEAKNTTGYYRVIKKKDSRYKQGFTWFYQYHDDKKTLKTISSTDLKKLEEKVLVKGLEWYKIGGLT